MKLALIIHENLQWKIWKRSKVICTIEFQKDLQQNCGRDWDKAENKETV